MNRAAFVYAIRAAGAILGENVRPFYHGHPPAKTRSWPYSQTTPKTLWQ